MKRCPVVPYSVSPLGNEFCYVTNLSLNKRFFLPQSFLGTPNGFRRNIKNSHICVTRFYQMIYQQTVTSSYVNDWCVVSEIQLCYQVQ